MIWVHFLLVCIVCVCIKNILRVFSVFPLQQITALKKENFNLKLRIYFLEERVQQKCDDSTEDIYKTVTDPHCHKHTCAQIWHCSSMDIDASSSYMHSVLILLIVSNFYICVCRTLSWRWRWSQWKEIWRRNRNCLCLHRKSCLHVHFLFLLIIHPNLVRHDTASSNKAYFFFVLTNHDVWWDILSLGFSFWRIVKCSSALFYVTIKTSNCSDWV